MFSSVKGIHLFSMPGGDTDIGPVSAFASHLELSCEPIANIAGISSGSLHKISSEYFCCLIKSVCIALNDTVVKMVVLCLRERSMTIQHRACSPKKSIVQRQCTNVKNIKNQTTKSFTLPSDLLV